MKIIIKDNKDFQKKIANISSALPREKSAEDTIKVVNFIQEEDNVYLMTTNRDMYMKTLLKCEVEGEFENFSLNYIGLKRELDKFSSYTEENLEKIVIKTNQRDAEISFYEKDDSKNLFTFEENPATSVVLVKKYAIRGATLELFKTLNMTDLRVMDIVDLKDIVDKFKEWNKVQSLKSAEVFLLENKVYSIISNIFAYVYNKQVHPYLKNISITFTTLGLLEKLVTEEAEMVQLERKEIGFNKQNIASSWEYKMQLGDYFIQFFAKNLEVVTYEDISQFFIQEIVGIETNKKYLAEKVRRFGMKEVLTLKIHNDMLEIMGDTRKERIGIQRIGGYDKNLKIKLTATILNQMLSNFIKSDTILFNLKENENQRSIELGLIVDREQNISTIISRVDLID